MSPPRSYAGFGAYPNIYKNCNKKCNREYCGRVQLLSVSVHGKAVMPLLRRYIPIITDGTMGWVLGRGQLDSVQLIGVSPLLMSAWHGKELPREICVLCGHRARHRRAVTVN
jgi:hypothetical protein